MGSLGGYEGISIRRIDDPAPVPMAGWSRRRWEFEAADGALDPFPLPPPLTEIDTFPLLVSSWWSGDKLVVDLFTRGQDLPVDALVHLSVVAAWVQHKAQGRDVLVNGVTRHPILYTSRLNDEVVAELTALGY
ncbi:hypothetical protein [Lentzea sp. NPDC051838]|uniref:hypothetical protein n=1 Tax=Lentzea sp. NPDC051838 TaxID=3154849 RepID=UPI003439D9BF